MSILLVEQNARLALSIAGHGYVMENGRIVLDDAVDKLKENADVKEFYLGLTEVGKKQTQETLAHLMCDPGKRCDRVFLHAIYWQAKHWHPKQYDVLRRTHMEKTFEKIKGLFIWEDVPVFG